MKLILCILDSMRQIFWEFTFYTLHFSVKTNVSFLWLVSNYQQFFWTAVYILTGFSASRKWIILKIHACFPTHIKFMRYIFVMFEQQLIELYRYNDISSGYIWASNEGIFMKICVLGPTNIQNTHKTKRLLRLVYDYICVRLIASYMFIFFIICFENIPQTSNQ